jgi:Type II secretion system (T2SS), protein M subtype b
MKRFGRLFPGTLFVGILAALFVVSWSNASRRDLLETTDRMAAVTKQEANLLQSLAMLGDGKAEIGIPEEDTWSGIDSASVEIALQQAVLAIADSSNLQLISFGAAPAFADASSDTVSYQLELTGDQADVARFLGALEKIKPALAVHYLWLRQLPADPLSEMVPVDLRLTVWGFRKIASEQP